MTVVCIYPEKQDPEDEEETLPEGWDEWKTSDTCSHDYCIEVHGYRLSAPRPMSRDEREEIEADRELMLDEFHGRNLDGQVI